MGRSASLSRQSIDHGEFRHAVQSLLLKRIFGGEYQEGHRLILHRIARELNLSITPVREAVLDLAALGVVGHRPNFGAEVVRFGAEELREIFEVRSILEAAATRGACGNIPLDMLQELDQKTRDLMAMKGRKRGLSYAISVDQELHRLITDHCGNRRLAADIRRYDVLMLAIRQTVGNRYRVQEEGFADHRTILAALIAADATAASTAMARHIEQAGQWITRFWHEPKVEIKPEEQESN